MLVIVEELICFAAICKTGSFTQAATLLDCSKSHVSRKLSALEKRYNTQLVRRTTRHLHLTGAGEKLKSQALSLLEEAQILHYQGTTGLSECEGHFRFTAPLSMSTFLLAPLLANLQTSFPNMTFELIPSNTNLKLVEDNVDLAIRTGQVVDESLVAKKIGATSEGFFCSSEYVDKFAKLNAEQLMSEPIVLTHFSDNGGMIKAFEQDTPVTYVPKSASRIGEFQVIANLLFERPCVGWLPHYYLGLQRQQHQLVRLLPEIRGQGWDVLLVFPFQTPLPKRLQAVIAFFTQHLRPQLEH